jgi:beta-glucanase (GH16 family)
MITLGKIAPALLLFAAQPAAAEGWQKVWSDEFDKPEIDPAKWNFDVDCWGGGNEERQCYTDKAENSSVIGGMLTITARKEATRGPALPLSQRKSAEDNKDTVEKPYSSARLTTRGLADWRYGRIAIRAKLPEGQGTWPAIWMLPTDNHYGRWAASGEIDIMEAVNLGTPCKKCAGGLENHVLGTLQFGGEWPANTLASSETELTLTPDGFHIFEIMWTANRISWAVDGRAYASAAASSWFSGKAGQSAAGAPFDQAFHLIINLAVGGGLPEGRNLKGVSNAIFPSQFQVDWVRVYQCDAITQGADECSK